MASLCVWRYLLLLLGVREAGRGFTADLRSVARVKHSARMENRGRERKAYVLPILVRCPQLDQGQTTARAD